MAGAPAAGNVVESFIISLRVDGSGEVTAELKKTNAELDKTENKAKKASQGMGIFDKRLMGTLATLVGFGVVLNKTFQFAQQAEQLSFMAQEANTTTGAIQTLGRALENFGGNEMTAANTLRSLNEEVRDLRNHVGGQKLMNAAWRFGLDLSGVKDGEDMLFRIAKRMEGLSTQRQMDLGRALGLDPATLRLVQGGVKQLNEELERSAKLNIYSQKDIENSRKFQRELRYTRDSYRAIWAVIARSLLPVGQKVVENLGKFFRLVAENKTAVLVFFGALSALLGVIAIKSAIAFAPFWIAVAVIAALALVVDDLWHLLEGGDSVSEKLIDGMVRGFGRMASFIKEQLELIINFWADMLLKLQNKWRDFKNWAREFGLGRYIFGADEQEQATRESFKFDEHDPNQYDEKQIRQNAKGLQTAYGGWAAASMGIFTPNLSSKQQNSTQNNHITIGDVIIQSSAETGEDMAGDFVGALQTDAFGSVFDNNLTAAVN